MSGGFFLTSAPANIPRLDLDRAGAPKPEYGRQTGRSSPKISDDGHPAKFCFQGRLGPEKERLQEGLNLPADRPFLIWSEHAQA